MKYEAVIGLEVHVQLNTKSKMFTRVAYNYAAPPNSLTNPVIMGLPGTLPVMNKGAIEKAITVGLIFNCEIAKISKWDRKNYFYPDMPKNYQISQYDQPLCMGGEVEIELPGPSRNIMGKHRKVQLTRIHLEEDTGKSTHHTLDSTLDFNRSGTPLIEIVSEPDLYSGEEAFAYLTALRTNLMYIDISDCDMEKGQMRCDVNISVREVGVTELGVKVELKNLNTISGVRNGIEFEIERQIKVLENNEKIVQETRLWNAERGITVSMRSKEQAHDYRYFPDPDLMPVKIKKETIKRLSNQLPEMPFDKQRRFLEDYDLPYTITSVICPDKSLSDFFEATVSLYNKPQPIANLIANDLLRELSSAGTGGPLPLSECKIDPQHIASLARMVDEGVISKQVAQDVFIEIFSTGDVPEKVIEEKGLKQSSNTIELEVVCRDIIDNNPKPAEEFKAGKKNAINALKGQVMRATKGKANPKIIDEILRKLMVE